MPKLEAKKVSKIFLDCLFKEEEVPDGKAPADALIVEGVRGKFGLHKGRVETHRQEVKEMLAELPDKFHTSKGGGWTFLNGCMDRDGNQWGEQIHVDELVVLGSALGLAHYQMPREMWHIFPGGVPYFDVDLER
jgi:hypothetical protein